MHKSKGFTLIELMIVVAIIGILSAIAIPAYNDYVINANKTKVVGHFDDAIKQVKTEMNKYANQRANNPLTPGAWSFFSQVCNAPGVAANAAQIVAFLNDVPCSGAVNEFAPDGPPGLAAAPAYVAGAPTAAWGDIGITWVAGINGLLRNGAVITVTQPAFPGTGNPTIDLPVSVRTIGFE